MIYVLDASAVLRWIDGEVGAPRVDEIVQSQLALGDPVRICAPHYGEVQGVIFRRHGLVSITEVAQRMSNHNIEIVSATGDLSVRSAILKVKTGLPYVDAFGVALTESCQGSTFVTADFDFKAIEPLIRIEFLPPKLPTPKRDR